ncbi:50S ribosomal protein L21 [Chrysiogenes arsenatis]|uniref:50S ribosomal protein L21 n=1 Tax=Chrysiogenes arsenatis TaxID=309797 RepID=UPI00042A6054|nr:50S ribosomal protein L21 [Chrysiogenes arsenatis]
MQAVIKTCGKQYCVSEGQVLAVSSLEGNVGEEIGINEVLMISGEKTVVGTPVVSGAKVTAEILAQFRGKKIIVFKSKRRKGYKKRNGHRQDLTKIKITKIEC